MRGLRFFCVGTRNDHVKTTQKPRASGRKNIKNKTTSSIKQQINQLYRLTLKILTL